MAALASAQARNVLPAPVAPTMARLWWVAHPAALGQTEDLGPLQPSLAAEVDVFDDGVAAQLGRLQVARSAPVLAFGQLPVDEQPEAFLEAQRLVLGLVCLFGQARGHGRRA